MIMTEKTRSELELIQCALDDNMTDSEKLKTIEMIVNRMLGGNKK